MYLDTKGPLMARSKRGMSFFLVNCLGVLCSIGIAAGAYAGSSTLNTSKESVEKQKKLEQRAAMSRGSDADHRPEERDRKQEQIEREKKKQQHEAQKHERQKKRAARSGLADDE